MRERLRNRRLAETFDLEVAGLRYTCTVGRFDDGRIGELFLTNHKSNSQADTNARDSAIVFSFAVQHSADPAAIRRALCRDSNGKASGPLGRALDLIAERENNHKAAAGIMASDAAVATPRANYHKASEVAE
jgi:ribonucleoside-diphosphate reductase alpha chain